jgi:hypothetical protein
LSCAEAALLKVRTSRAAANSVSIFRIASSRLLIEFITVDPSTLAKIAQPRDDKQRTAGPSASQKPLGLGMTIIFLVE